MNEKLIKDYKSFLDECKTERECVTRIIKDAEKKRIQNYFVRNRINIEEI